MKKKKKNINDYQNKAYELALKELWKQEIREKPNKIKGEKWEEQMRMKIDDYLFDTNLRWATIHSRIINLLPITPDQKDEYEIAIDKIKQLIDILLVEEKKKAYLTGYKVAWAKRKRNPTLMYVKPKLK